MSNIIQYFLVSVLVISCIQVITTNHPIFSLIHLIVSFLSASSILFMLECEFLALIFITVYVGAIAVLFLFSIMMLDFKRQNLQKNLIKFLPLSLFFGFILLFPLIKSIYMFFPSIPLSNFYMETNLNWFDFSNSLSELEVLGKILYTHCAVHLLLAGVILLVVLFGVVHLTTSVKTISSRNQVMFKQLSKSIKLN